MAPMTADEGDGAAATVIDRLLELSGIDTEADQLARRRANLPEREQLAAVSKQLTDWESARGALRARLDELDGVIERAEQDAAVLVGQKERLEGQLKTVIAPREAEALMSEIATLDEQRDGLETAEIEALEEQSALDDRLSAHLADEPALRAATSSADAALAAATAEIDADLDGLRGRRDVLAGTLSADLLGRYERIRTASGQAVVRLVGRRCDGCHLDLSAAEVEDAKDESAAGDGIAHCPQCGRMLIV